MAKAVKDTEELSVLHIRLSKENGPKIMKLVKKKMKDDTRNQNNCVEAILVEYFKLNK